jgi:hypothetical protein
VAETLPNGPAKVALLEEAVRLADAHQQLDEAFWLRKRLVNAANFAGYPEKALTAFTWRLAQSDRNPERFPESSLLWEYKWVLDSLADFPQIGWDAIDGAFADLQRRYERAGAPAGAVEVLALRLALARGDLAAADRLLPAVEPKPRDGFRDCPACVQDLRHGAQLRLGRWEEAVREAEPILAGRMACSCIPHETLASVLEPLLRLGRPDEAMRHHRRGYRMVSGNRSFVGAHANHLLFLTLTDNLGKAVTVFEQHFPFTWDQTNLDLVFHFHRAAGLLLDRLGDQGRDRVRLRLPAGGWPLHRADGQYAVAEVRQWLEGQVQDLAARFDRRNGTATYAGLLAERADLLRLVTPHPLRGAPPGEG